MNKIKFYRRVRSAIMGITGKSNERIIADCTMVSSLANDKGISMASQNKVNKRLLKQSKASQYRRTGIKK